MGIKIRVSKKDAMRMSKVLIRKAEKAIQNLPVTPQVHTYVKMYQVLEELHFQGEYKLASEICNVLLKNLGAIE